MSDEKEPLDYHCFEVWRYTDGTFDLNAKVHEGQFQIGEAADAALVLTRCLREDFRNTRLVCAVELYQNGQTACHWRNDEDKAANLKEFLWVKRALGRGTYGNVLPGEKLPAWILNSLGFLEFCVSKIWNLWVRVTGRNSGYTSVTRSSPTAPPAPAGVAQQPSEEAQNGSEGPIEHGAGNVVWVRQWGRKDNTD